MYRLWIVWYACTVHLFWAVLLLISADPLYSTPVSGLNDVVDNRYVIAFMLILASTLVLATMSQQKANWCTLLAPLPQQALLVLSALASFSASWNQMYADGVPRPFGFIFADQLPTMAAAFFHGCAIVGFHWRSQWRL